jgi:uncharacterized NAD-dependent epimerase/dehydratase family protein
VRKTREREIKVAAWKLNEFLDDIKEAKEVADKAKEINEKGLAAKERKRGDTIKEYKAQIREAFNRAMNAQSLGALFHADLSARYLAAVLDAGRG